MVRLPPIVFVFLLVFVATTSLPFQSAQGAADIAGTARNTERAYTTAQREWQGGLAELVIEKKPDFEAVATTQRDLQWAYLERRTARFEHLLARNPSRIVLTEGLSRFTNFDWSREDTEILRKADPEYAALEAKVAALRKRNDDQRDWPSFREYFRNTLVKSKEYQALLGEFMEKQKAVEGLLAAAQ